MQQTTADYTTFQELYDAKFGFTINTGVVFGEVQKKSDEDFCMYFGSVSLLSTSAGDELRLLRSANISINDLDRFMRNSLGSIGGNRSHVFPYYSLNGHRLACALKARQECSGRTYRALSPGDVVYPNFIVESKVPMSRTPHPVGVVIDIRGLQCFVLWEDSTTAVLVNNSTLLRVNYTFTHRKWEEYWYKFTDRDVWEGKFPYPITPLPTQVEEEKPITEDELTFIARKFDSSTIVIKPVTFGWHKNEIRPPEESPFNNQNIIQHEIQRNDPATGQREQTGEAHRRLSQEAQTQDGGGYTSDRRSAGRSQGEVRCGQISGYKYAAEYRPSCVIDTEGNPGTTEDSGRLRAGSGSAESGVQTTVPGERKFYDIPNRAVMQELFECGECGEQSVICIQHHTYLQSEVYECLNPECEHTFSAP